MKVIFDNDLLSLCAGAVISCVYIVMISDFIYHAVKHGIRGMAVFRVFSAVSAMALVISGLTAHGALYHAMSSDIALSSMIILVAGSAGTRYQEEIPLAVLASLLFASSLAVAAIRFIFPSESGEAGISCWIPVILSVSIILFTFVKSVSDFSSIREFLRRNSLSGRELPEEFWRIWMPWIRGRRPAEDTPKYEKRSFSYAAKCQAECRKLLLWLRKVLP